MATLQKFKLLATQCAVAGSPSRSPTTSPVFQLRRRKTLKMFLSRSGSGRNRFPPRQEESPSNRKSTVSDLPQKTNQGQGQGQGQGLLSNKLKDLFVSSPPLDEVTEKVRDKGEALMDRVRRTTSRHGGSGSPRPLSAAFRYRLLRRPWRPLLVTIPE